MMIDEALLEEQLARIADEIPVPREGARRALETVAVAARPARERASHLGRMLAAAAAVVVIGGLGVMLSRSIPTNGGAKSAVSAPAKARTGGVVLPSPNFVHGDARDVGRTASAQSLTPPNTPNTSSAGPTDAAKIVKTGALDVEVPHGRLRLTVNRITGVAVGLAGYVADSKTNYSDTDATAQITMRVPVSNFETAITRLNGLPDATVTAQSQNGTDVTAQYTDLQARLRATAGERDQLLAVLSHAQTIGDILAVRDRIGAVQTQVDQLQGQINLLADQAAFSSLAVTLSESPSAGAGAHRTSTGLGKAWSDARHGFADVTEWLLARSGGALIVLLTALALLFGIRYLYPLIRRGLI